MVERGGGDTGIFRRVFLNRFADTAEPLNMTQTEEFRLLCASAAQPRHFARAPDTQYRSRNIVLRQLQHFLEWGAPDAPAVVLLHGGHQSAHSWDLVALPLARRFGCWRSISAGMATANGAHVSYTNHAMSLDAEAFIAALVPERPILMGHSMGGRNAMCDRRDPLLRRLMIVDVGPEVSDRGREVIAGFVRDTRSSTTWSTSCGTCSVTSGPSREPSNAREIQHACSGPTGSLSASAMEPAADRGRSRKGPAGEHHARGCAGVRPACTVGAGRRLADLDRGCCRAFSGRVAAGDTHDRAGLRPQRAWAEYEGVHRGDGGFCRMDVG